MDLMTFVWLVVGHGGPLDVSTARRRIDKLARR
jgi:hypothetical protein